MCNILPVDHLSCSHTVAIWEHCIDAPRTRLHGLAPCSHIRQHPRPILTRKACHNCGGPRFFARRGGIAARGQGSISSIQNEKEKIEDSDANDSGYASDAFADDDDASSFSTSPRSPRVTDIWTTKRHGDAPVSTKHKSPSHKTWKPSLKLGLGGEKSPFCRRESVDDNSASKFEDGIGRAARTAWPAKETLAPSTERHDSVQRPHISPRKNSTLLHPSSPTVDAPPMFPLTSTSTSTPRRPALGDKNDLTLLYPSPPQKQASQPPRIRPFSVKAKANCITIEILKPETVHVPRRKSSVIHSSLSDVEYSESEYSEYEDDEAEVVVARSARVSRASWVSWRV